MGAQDGVARGVPFVSAADADPAEFDRRSALFEKRRRRLRVQLRGRAFEAPREGDGVGQLARRDRTQRPHAQGGVRKCRLSPSRGLSHQRREGPQYLDSRSVLRPPGQVVGACRRVIKENELDWVRRERHGIIAQHVRSVYTRVGRQSSSPCNVRLLLRRLLWGHHLLHHCELRRSDLRKRDGAPRSRRTSKEPQMEHRNSHARVHLLSEPKRRHGLDSALLLCSPSPLHSRPHFRRIRLRLPFPVPLGRHDRPLPRGSRGPRRNQRLRRTREHPTDGN
mmetsp:Transcript_2182/g.6477  ORF Transcript_2182/g.6477 Transcript_2182/m.6477 type:complete len:279 (+) Transcript_2182:289-1125(+)